MLKGCILGNNKKKLGLRNLYHIILLDLLHARHFTQHDRHKCINKGCTSCRGSCLHLHESHKSELTLTQLSVTQTLFLLFQREMSAGK